MNQHSGDARAFLSAVEPFLADLRRLYDEGGGEGRAFARDIRLESERLIAWGDGLQKHMKWMEDLQKEGLRDKPLKPFSKEAREYGQWRERERLYVERLDRPLFEAIDRLDELRGVLSKPVSAHITQEPA
ncbi:MAG TPA: hypothetical protein VHE10_03655 [Candidatus Paceibacterota bacterium]|nr:hypothetical protein [Candidatus Paceibacterota bacterium]